MNRRITKPASTRAPGVVRIIGGDWRGTRLPVADASVDVVTCSMAMMLVHPIDRALGEVRRVLHQSGELRLLLPTQAPLTIADRLRYLRLFWAARSTASASPASIDSRPRSVVSSKPLVSSRRRKSFCRKPSLR